MPSRTTARGAASDEPPIGLCIMTTVGLSIRLLYRDRLEYLQRNGFDVTVVCAPSEFDDEIRARCIRLYTVPFTRNIAPWQDLRALWSLWWFLRRSRFDLVEVSTPKAALVGSVAAWMARVPRLVHVLRGLAYEGQSGAKRRILHLSTMIPCRLAHDTISISPSLRDQAHRDGVCATEQVRVLGAGTYKGVDLDCFSPRRRALGPGVRTRYDIPQDAVVVGFIGRMTRDKGLNELVAAVRRLRSTVSEFVLLLVGAYEERDRPSAEVIGFLDNAPCVRRAGWQYDVVPFLAAMDIFVLPTHREGFGNVLIEAAAMGLPTVTTNVTGSRDATLDGVTGFQVPVGDADALREALQRLIDAPDLRRKMGAAGRRWVEQNFDQQRVWQLYADEYRRLVSEAR